MKRYAGVLMSITSLPSKYGIGCFSQEAYDFVDWLKDAGQTYWQILPVGPTSFGDSPYQSFSTFAGNPYFISLEALIEEGEHGLKNASKKEIMICDAHTVLLGYGGLSEEQILDGIERLKKAWL